MVQASIRSASAEDGKAVRDAAMQWYVALNAMLKGDPEPSRPSTRTRTT